MIADQDINDLRKIALSILDWTAALIDGIGIDEYWGCLGNDEAISSAIKEQLSYIREHVEKDENELFLALRKLPRRLGKQAGKEPGYVDGVVNRELDNLVIRCAKHPGPEEYFDSWDKPKLKWDIRFSEEQFNQMVKNIGELLSLPFVDKEILVRAECRGFKFNREVTLSDALYYEEDSSQFVLRFENDASIQEVRKESLRVFNALEAILRLVYGFDVGLGRIIVIYPYSRGGERHIIEGRASFYATAHDAKSLSDETLRSIWDQSFQALNQGSRHVSRLIAKALSLGPSYDSRLLDLMICYEMILADGDEIRYKLSIRGAALLNKLGVGNSYDTIWQAYKDRNALVHGDLLFNEEARNRIVEANSKLSLWLRLLTLAFLLYNGERESFVKCVDQLVKKSINPTLVGEVDPSFSRLEEAIKTVNALQLLAAIDRK